MPTLASTGSDGVSELPIGPHNRPVSTVSQPALGSTQPGLPDRVRFRATWRQRLPLCGLPIFVIGLWIANPVFWAPAMDTSAVVTIGRWAAVVVTAVVVFEIWLVGWWFGATLTDKALLVHGLRQRVIPWSRVTAVQVERFVGAQRVVVYDVDGRRTRLRMPSSVAFGRDATFASKAAFIGHWWLTHRAV